MKRNILGIAAIIFFLSSCSDDDIGLILEQDLVYNETSVLVSGDSFIGEGSEATINVKLSRPPVETVIVTLSTSAPDEISFSSNLISFTKDNYNALHSITIRSLGENIPLYDNLKINFHSDLIPGATWSMVYVKNPKFTEIESIQANEPADNIYLEDLDGDGKKDLIIINGDVYALGIENFEGSIDSPEEDYENYDFSQHDNTRTTDRITILRNISTQDKIVFSKSFEINPPGISIQTLDIGDIDGDGKKDIVAITSDSDKIINHIPGVKDYYALTSDNESYYCKPGYPKLYPYCDTNLNLQDDFVYTIIDNEGLEDTSTIAKESDFLVIYRNISTNGNIEFDELNAYYSVKSPGEHTKEITLKDLNNDNLVDLIIAEGTAHSVSYQLNSSTSGSISLESPIELVLNNQDILGKNNYSLFVQDINGDNKDEIATISNYFDQLIILKNKSQSDTPLFDTSEENIFPTIDKPVMVRSADFNKDGKSDIAITHRIFGIGYLTIYQNDSTVDKIKFPIRNQYTLGNSPEGLTIVDINNDGYTDILITNTQSNTAQLFINKRNNDMITFQTPGIEFATFGKPTAIVAEDLDLDGDIDFMILSESLSKIQIFENNNITPSDSE